MDKWGTGNSSDAMWTGGNPRAPNVVRFDPRTAHHDPVAAPHGPGAGLASYRVDPAPSSTAAGQPTDTRPPQVQAKDPQATPPLAKQDGSAPAVKATAEERKVSNSGGSNGGGTKSGGGGGGRGSSPLQKATGGDEYRETLSKGLSSIKRNFLTIGIFSFAVNLLALSIPIYLFNMSDRVLTSRSVDTLIMLTTIVMFAIAAHVLMDMMRRFILMRVAVDTEARLGGPVLSAAAKAAQSGSIREFQTLADLQQLRSFMTGPVLLTMFDAPISPIYLVVVFLIHPQLGLIVTAAGLGLTGLALLNQRVTADPFTRASAFVTRANLQAEAMARNAQVINAMGMIPEGVRVWGQETVESLKAQVIAQDRNIIMTGLSKFLRLGTQITILGWGAVLALESHLTGGMIIAASIVSSRALAPLEGTIEGWRSYVHARSAYQRIRTLLQNTPLNLRRLRLPRPEGRLSVERILYVPSLTKKVILNGVSFQLDPGKSLAIVGPSGTGKTMLARMLVGSIIPTAGNVRLDLMDLRNWDPRQFGECVGYLPQDVQLFPASIKANIARMRDDARDADIFDAAETADVHEMIAEFPQGYETVIGMDGSPLSGGQRQRIGLARAFYGSPRLVVLDEPNANLDTSGELALAKALARAKQKGTTIVAVTQRPALLQSVDKILILQNGSVQAFGARDEMIHLLSGRKPPNGGGSSPGGPPILNA